jgi:hypothetical protein
MAEEAEDEDEGIIVPLASIASPDKLIYADILAHVSAINGVARLTFTQSHPVREGESQHGWQSLHAVVVAIPIVQFGNMMDYLRGTEADFQAKGWLPKASKDAD